MDLIDHLQALASKIQKQREVIQTEEGTKNAFVLPFIHALGYDVFNPLEVVPEFTADVGIKKGEKVDYAIQKDGKVIMLFECKCCTAHLDRQHASQLFRYFTVTEARIGILTNGVEYQFYTDLEVPNRMDERPFMEFNLLELNEALIPEIKKLTQSRFNLEETISAAEELKYTKGIRKVVEQEFSEPSEDFVKHFASQIYTGRITQNVREHFTGIVKKAIQQYINDRINDRIKVALSNETEREAVDEEQIEVEESTDRNSRIETTQEEQEAYLIVKTILRQVVEAERIAARDTISYFGVLLDNNNRRPICRFHFNRNQKYLGLFDENKNERRVPLESLDDIFNYSDALILTIGFYENSDNLNDDDIPELEGSQDSETDKEPTDQQIASTSAPL